MKLIDKLKNIEVNWEGTIQLGVFILICTFFIRLAIFITDFLFI